MKNSFITLASFLTIFLWSQISWSMLPGNFPACIQPVPGNSTGIAKPDSAINPKAIAAYANTLNLLKTDPTLRSELNDEQLKTLLYYENLFRTNRDFKIRVNESAKKNETQNTKDSTSKEAARDHKKASMDNIQKFLDILHSMKPQI